MPIVSSMSESPELTHEHPKKRRFGCLWLLLGFCCLNLAWCHYNPLNRFPDTALAALRSDPQAIFYSLDPHERTNDKTSGFHVYQIVGQTALTHASEREALVDRIAASTHGAWNPSACFDPRHAFRAHAASGIFDFLLCFKCGRAQIHHPDGRQEMIFINHDSEFLDEYLTAHGVSLPTR